MVVVEDIRSGTVGGGMRRIVFRSLEGEGRDSSEYLCINREETVVLVMMMMLIEMNGFGEVSCILLLDQIETGVCGNRVARSVVTSEP